MIGDVSATCQLKLGSELTQSQFVEEGKSYKLWFPDIADTIEEEKTIIIHQKSHICEVSWKVKVPITAMQISPQNEAKTMEEMKPISGNRLISKTCEGCGKVCEDIEIFFRHVSHAKKCKNAYGERYQTMKDERKIEVARKRNSSTDVHEAKKEAKEKGCTLEQALEDMIEDGYMIKCEGCEQFLHTDTFFKHASHSKRCKEVYGPRLEAMKKEKRREVKAFSYKRNQEKSKDYYIKNKETISKQKKQKFQENKLQKKEAKEEKDRDFKLFDEYDQLARKFKKQIYDWRDCRHQDYKDANEETQSRIKTIISKVGDVSEEFYRKISKRWSELSGTDYDLQKRSAEKHFEDWKNQAKLLDDSLKAIVDIELTCYHCFRNDNCTPNCENITN